MSEQWFPAYLSCDTVMSTYDPSSSVVYLLIVDPIFNYDLLGSFKSLFRGNNPVIHKKKERLENNLKRIDVSSYFVNHLVTPQICL